ncbi:MAG TPA: hypothetical protein VME21_10985 [Steroidobacteraceae bacterium]|nr:hypothetical protein [Steroidobacteraceae bacterium]
MGSINPEREARRRGAPTDPLRLFESRFRLHAVCQRLGCEHRRELNVALLIRAFGPEATLRQVASRLRCSHCGQRGPRVQARYVGPRGDGR